MAQLQFLREWKLSDSRLYEVFERRLLIWGNPKERNRRQINVMQNFEERLRTCVRQEGRHLSDIIFRNWVINVSNQNCIYYRLFWCWQFFYIENKQGYNYLKNMRSFCATRYLLYKENNYMFRLFPEPRSVFTIFTRTSIVRLRVMICVTTGYNFDYFSLNIICGMKHFTNLLMLFFIT